MDINKKEFEHHKTVWSTVAKNNNWYNEPFHIQVWINKKGEILDSVSIKNLSQDYVFDSESGKEITDFKLV